jgi:DNA mismatch repair protein MutS2
VRGEGARAIEDLRREGSAILADLKAGAKSRRDLGQTLATAASRIDRIAPRAHDQAVPESEIPLKVGDQVELGEIRGELLSLDDDRAVVGRGGLRIEVSADRIRRARAARVPAQEPRVTVTSSGSDRNELNLVGMRTGEALRKLEEFLDQAYLTNRAEVRVIHGIGSGALKKAVHEYLETSPYCGGFRQAEPHQGGAGATIAKIGP